MSMHRRQFIGASLAAAIASFCLPFERFTEWMRDWLKPKNNRVLLDALSADIDHLYEQLGEQLNRYCWGTETHA